MKQLAKNIAKKYVKTIDAVSRTVGKAAMFLVLGMIGILVLEAISRTFFKSPHIWSIELSQFVMVAYYILGGAWTLLLDGHVRMDLLYHKWTPRKKAMMDIMTFIIVLTYLGILLYGAMKGTGYAIKYKQVSYSAWRPSLIPIKVIMTAGIILMLLQNISEIIKDLAVLRGRDIARIRKDDNL